MRAVLLIALIGLGGCELAPEPADSSSVMIELPPPTQVQAAPGFSADAAIS